MNNDSEFEFYEHCDSVGYDLFKVNAANVDELKKICKHLDKCVAFNTLGYLKFKVDSITQNPLFADKSAGFYVYKKRVQLYQEQNKSIAFDAKTRIKCVNLERRPDRKETMQKLLTDADLIQHCDFFEAVDGKKLEPTDEIKYLFRNNDFHYRRGVIGCALSHYYLWQELVNDEKYENYLILEDDIRFNSVNPKKDINQLFELLKIYNNWNLVHIGHHLPKQIYNAYNELYGNRKELNLILHLHHKTYGGTFGYMINKSGAKKILDLIEKYGITCAIDRLIDLYRKEINIIEYEPVPHIVLSDYVTSNGTIDSDIQNDYDSLYK